MTIAPDLSRFLPRSLAPHYVTLSTAAFVFA
jgi:hypothetical protein